MRRARTWRWVRVFLIPLQGWCCPPMSDLGIIWAHEQSYAPARCWAACIASIRSRPLWTNRVFADHRRAVIARVFGQNAIGNRVLAQDGTSGSVRVGAMISEIA